MTCCYQFKKWHLTRYCTPLCRTCRFLRFKIISWCFVWPLTQSFNVSELRFYLFPVYPDFFDLQLLSSILGCNKLFSVKGSSLLNPKPKQLLSGHVFSRHLFWHHLSKSKRHMVPSSWDTPLAAAHFTVQGSSHLETLIQHSLFGHKTFPEKASHFSRDNVSSTASPSRSSWWFDYLYKCL